MNTTDQPHFPGLAGGSHAAEHWFLRTQRGGCSAAERRAFRDWQQASPANAMAYAQVAALYRTSADFAQNPDYRATGQAARERAEREGRRRRHLRRWGSSLAAAAVLLLAVGTGWHLWDPAQPPHRFATAIGQQRDIALDDGSRVRLDTNSALVVRYSRKHRDVVLERGRAQFDVAPAPHRPFTVHAGPGTVRALGTQFQVRHHADAVQVVLLEGVVKVSVPAARGKDKLRSTTLAPGQRLDFDAGGRWTIASVDNDTARGWTRGELIFQQHTLHELLDEANRYSTAQIHIGDASLYDLRVSGVFDSNDQASLLQALEAVLPVRAERVSEGEIVLHHR